MPAPISNDELIDLVRKSGVLDDKRLEAHMQALREAGQFTDDPVQLAAALVRDGLLTNFQSEQLIQGKWKRFTLGKYRVLERLGSGGMGSVFLCEHKFMRRRVAVKVLPTAKAADPSSLERFYREARAVAAVDHPNIVHAYDIDQDENLHFIVMEFVDGPSLQEIVRRSGPLNLERACHYISQAAQGLDHANQAGLVHRDIKPANILVDRTGIVKILDMGLARFFNDEEDMLTRKYDENVLGTADYLAPEQADDSHAVDIRADIYSLGGTFYFLLTGKTPFDEGTVPQKLMWHRTRQPKPISTYRSDVPTEVQAVIDKMMAKEPEQRYQLPGEISIALAPWTADSIEPPAENEMPRLSAAATGGNAMTSVPGITKADGPGSGAAKKHRPSFGTSSPAQPAPTVVSKNSNAPVTRRANGVARGPKSPVSPRPTPRTAPGGSAAAASGQPAAPRLAAAIPVEEEGSPWVSVGPDTADPAAQGDTPPQTPAKSRPPVQPAAAPAFLVNRRLLFLLAAGAFTLLILLVVALIALVLAVRGRTVATNQSLTVGKGSNFTTVRAALVNAKTGDRILLLDKDHRECLSWEGGENSGILIQPAPGVEVVWSAPAATGESETLLHLSQARGFQVKGIRFAGEGRIRNLIRLTGHSPGLRLDNLTLEGFTQCAVVVANCTGTVREPIQLTGLKTSTGGKLTEAAILFDAEPVPPLTNEHITVNRNCRLDGSFAHGQLWFKKERSNTIIVP